MRRKTLAPLTLVVLGIAILIGCIPLPGGFKQRGDRPRPEASIGQLNSDKAIKVRGSTFGQVIDALGPPTMSSDDRRILVYTYEVNDISLFWPLCFWEGADPEFHQRYLLLRFDDAGRLQSFKTYKDLNDLHGDSSWTAL